MNTIGKIVLVGGMAAVLGCASSPVSFQRSSVPVPPQGYTVIGSDVTGTSDQYWFLGLGGSLSPQQHTAYKEAIGRSNGADALVGMSIESHGFIFFPLFAMHRISVTGTPVKFNPPPQK